MKKIDVIFNALHGRDGEDGVAQIILNISEFHILTLE